MKNTKFFVFTLIAAAAMTTSAYADSVSLENGSKHTLGKDGTGAGNTYSYNGPAGEAEEKGAWLVWGDALGDATSGMKSLGTAGSSTSLTGTGLIGLTFASGSGNSEGGDGFDLTNVDASAFAGQLVAVNQWNNSTNVKVSGETWKNTTYVFAGVSHEIWKSSGSPWRMYNDTARGRDTLTLSGATTFSGIQGTSKGFKVINGNGVAVSTNAYEFIGAETAGTVLTIAGAKENSFYGTVGSSSVAVGVNMTGTGTQVFGGTNYFDVVSTVSGSTLDLSGSTTSIAGAVTNAGTLNLSGATVSLSSAISNTGTVLIDASTVFALDELELNTKYDLVQGDGTIDGTIGIHNFSVGGVALTGRTTGTISNSEGVLSVTVTAFNDAESVTWAGTDSSHVWDMNNATNAIWKLGDEDDAFYARDNATFGTEASYKTVTIGGDIFAGTVTVNDDYTFSATADSTLDTGIITVASGKTLTLSVETDKTLTVLAATNGGANLVKSGSGTVNIANTGNDFSSVSVEEGLLEFGGAVGKIKTLNVESGATLSVVAGNDLVFWNNGHENNVYNIEGTLNLNTTRLSIDRGIFSLSGGTISGTGDGQGALDFYGKSQTTTIDVSGVSTVSATIRVRKEESAVTIADFVVAEDSTLNFSGEKIDEGTMKKSGTGTMNFSGTVSAGKLELAGGETNFTGTLASNATLNVSGGTTNFSGTIDANTGAFIVEKDAVLNFSKSYGQEKVSGDGRVVIDAREVTGHGTSAMLGSNFQGTLAFVGNFNLATCKVGENAVIELSGTKYEKNENDHSLYTENGIACNNQVKITSDYLIKFGSRSQDIVFEKTVSADKGTTVRIANGWPRQGNGITFKDTVTFDNLVIGGFVNAELGDGRVTMEKGGRVGVLALNSSGILLALDGTLLLDRMTTGGDYASPTSVSIDFGTNGKITTTQELNFGTHVTEFTFTLTLTENQLNDLNSGKDVSREILLGSGNHGIWNFVDHGEKTISITNWENSAGYVGAVASIDELEAGQWGYISFDGNAANVADSVTFVMAGIPEPSAFGLLAGVGALALCVSRRRRVKKA